MTAEAGRDRSGAGAALALANTRHGSDARRPFEAGTNTRTRNGADRLRSPAELSGFLARLGLVVPPGSPELAQLVAMRDLREAVRALAEGDLATYLRRLRRVTPMVTFRFVGLHPRAIGEGWTAFIGECLRSAVELHVDRDRLRVCHNSACGWIFIDGSPGRAQVWCTMQHCGERIRARRYRRRHGHAAA